MASSCSRENSPGRARQPGLSSGLGGGGGGVPSPQPGRRRPAGTWRRPSSHCRWRSASAPLADLCGRPRGSPCARDFQTSPAGSLSQSPHPAWGQSSRVAGTRQGHGTAAPAIGGRAGNPAAPPAGPSRASVPARNKPRFPSFQSRLLGTYTLLGLLFLPTLSLPVSMATPPNSRFQAAMTSPFPFLPPRPGGTAARAGLGLPRLQPDPGPRATAGFPSLRAAGTGAFGGWRPPPPGPWSSCARAPSRAHGPGATRPPTRPARLPAPLAAR